LNTKHDIPSLNQGVIKSSRNTDVSDTSIKPIELFDELRKGLKDISLGNTRPFAEAMADVKVKCSK